MRFGWFWMPGLALCLAACDRQGAAPVAAPVAVAPQEPQPFDGVGAVAFIGPLLPVSSRLLIQALDKMQVNGARTIDLLLDSPGGLTDPAQSVVSEMDRLHEQGVTFVVYDNALVASAATLIFLDAQQRYAVPGSNFVFHAPSYIAVGMFSADKLRAFADSVDRYADLVRRTLLARTRLTRAQADVYVTRTVMLSADDALRDGVIDAIRRPVLAKGVKVWTIRVVVTKKPPAAAPAG